MPIRLLNSVTATSLPPSAATDGVPLNGARPSGGGYYNQVKDAAVLSLRSTAGSGTMEVMCRLWGWHPATLWTPMGIGDPVADRGLINDGVTVAEDGADTLVHSQPVSGLSACTRVYLQVTAIGGTGTAITAWLTERAI